MAVTETETISYGSRLGGSIKNVVWGVLAFLAAFPLLFWNEGRAVKTARALDEGEGACVSVESNRQIDSDNEGKLVHMTGKAETKDILTDPIFGVSENCISLKREVEIYQWVQHEKTEEKKNLGGSVTKKTTYTYKLEWCDAPVSSAGFKEGGHENPPGGMEFENEEWKAQNVSFGAFHLSEKQIGMIGSSKIYSFPGTFTSKVARVQIAGKVMYVPEAKTRNNPLNNRDVASQTRPGDMRVTYRMIMPHDISIVAKQRGESFCDYVAKNKRKLNMLDDDVKDAQEMFEDARDNNALWTWIFRIVGFLVMCIGIKTILKPLAVLADVLPFLGSIIDVGAGIVATIIAFALSVVTIAIAWLFYRPLLAVLLLSLAVAGIVGIVVLVKKASGPRVADVTDDAAQPRV